MAPSKPTPTHILITFTPQPNGSPTTYLGIPHPLTILPGKYGTTFEIISTLSPLPNPTLESSPNFDLYTTTTSTSSPNPTSTSTGGKGGNRGGGTITLPDGTVAGTAPGPDGNSDGNGNEGGKGQKAGSESVRAGVGIGVVGFVLVFGAVLLVWVRRRGGKREVGGS